MELKQGVGTVMQLRISKMKAIIAFMLALCFVMPFFSSTASAFFMITHTHICYDEEHKDNCDDVRECCKICRDFIYEKNGIQILYSATANKLPMTFAPSSGFLTSEFLLLCPNSTTLISLKVRLNN